VKIKLLVISCLLVGSGLVWVGSAAFGSTERSAAALEIAVRGAFVLGLVALVPFYLAVRKG
jgi:hypothetical protein